MLRKLIRLSILSAPDPRPGNTSSDDLQKREVKRRFLKVLLPAAAASLLAGSPLWAGDVSAPPTKVAIVTETYHGVTVADPYRWLEATNESEVKAWNVAQDKYSRAYLDKLPIRHAIHARLTKLTNETSPVYSRL